MADQISPERSLDEKRPYTSGAEHAPGLTTEDYEGKPTEEERKTLRRVPGSLPTVAYLICVVEFCERASYYGCQPLFSNFVNRPLPVGGNGYGAPAEGTQQTAGALGMGTVKANAVSQSFSLLCYALPLIFGYLADAKTGRFKLICWGVLLFGIAHVLLVGASAPGLLASGAAKTPFFISVYLLAVGSGKSTSPNLQFAQFINVIRRYLQAQCFSSSP
jgi:dipeptide/tripeptide permease